MAFLRSRVAGTIGLVCVHVLASASVVSAQTEGATENEVKAAFLYNFAKYIEWPPSAFGPDGVFRICVFADAAFVKNVDAIVAGETIDGRQVQRRVPDSVESVRSCHILFIARSEMERAQRFLAAIQTAPVLTVSDVPDFVARGGDIAFIRDGSRIRFDVNVADAQRSGLSVSSRLLRVARRVIPSSQGTE